jgi:MFS family permease
MNKYLKTTLVFAGVWFTAAFLNGLLSGISIAVLDDVFNKAGVSTLLLSVVFSFVFSAPVVGLVWFIVLMAQVADKQGDDLFRFALRTAFICAIAAALVFIFTLGTEFKQAGYAVALSIIISALTAVLFFRKQIKTNE